MRRTPRPPLLLLAAAAIAAAGCGHVTQIRPTPKGQVDVEATLGGPLGQIEGLPVELPLLTAGASYGVLDRLDVEAHAHVTPLVFGVAGVDAGASYLALEQRGAVPAVNVNARLYGFANLVPDTAGTTAARAYAELTPAASWLLGERFLTYLSGTAFLQLAGGPPLFSVAAGEQVQLGRWGAQLEVRWYEPNYPSQNLPTGWSSIGGLGAWGVLLSARYRFGGGAP